MVNATTRKPSAWRNNIVGSADVAPADLVPHPENWRRHPKAQQAALSGALAELGWIQNVIVNKRTGRIIDGHARVELAVANGEPTVPVVYVDLTDDEERTALATLDPLGAMFEQDQGAFDALRDRLTVQDAGLLAMLDGMRTPVLPVGLTDPDDVPPVPAEPTTQPGDLWLLGEHRLLCGDSTKAEDVARLMGGAKAALMWTDPPYGVSYVGKTADALEIQNDGAEGLPGLLRATFAACGAALAEGSPFYIARPAGALSIAFGNAIDGAGWQLHEELQWVKDSLVLGHSDYHLRHETILYGWLPGPGRSGRGKHEGSRWYGGNAETSVFEIPRPKASPDHPTGKPVELVERHVANSSRAADGVYEPFSGSGTTLIACERLARRCYAMEIEPRYVDVAVRRWEQFTGQEAQRAETG